MHGNDFTEIAHSGGQVIFTVRTDAGGNTQYQVGFRHSRPVPTALVGLYARPHGSILGPANLMLLGKEPAPDGTFIVLLASDSEERFGHVCPKCGMYWRSGPWPNLCPYCAYQAPAHFFLSDAQQRYVRHYLETLLAALDEVDNGSVIIDMDAVADAAGREGERPAFYISEERQQHSFQCQACNAFNDILGRFGYCSECGTRNDLQEFVGTVAAVRVKLNAGVAPEDCTRDGVAAFDSFVSQYAKEFVARVPMTKRRRDRLGRAFHDLREVAEIFSSWFDIDIQVGISEPDRQFAALRFHRRHVYEHNGGEADEKYLKRSGETNVRLKQRLREVPDDVHHLLGLLSRMATNLHQGFHELLPVLNEPIERWDSEKARRRKDSGREEQGWSGKGVSATS